MAKSYAVTVFQPDHEPVRIGPFLALRTAWTYGEALKGLTGRIERTGAGVQYGPFDEDRPHLDPRPADEELQRAAVGQIDLFASPDEDTSPFPSVTDRWRAAEEALPTMVVDSAAGQWLRFIDHVTLPREVTTAPTVDAARALPQECSWRGRQELNLIHALAATVGTSKAEAEQPSMDTRMQSRREVLAARGERLQRERAAVNEALKKVAVDLWRDGLHNVQEIGRLTGFARNTVYEALREADIEPATRRATTANLAVAVRTADGTLHGAGQDDVATLPCFRTRLTRDRLAPPTLVDQDLTVYYRPGAKVSEATLGRALGYTLRAAAGADLTASVTEPVHDALFAPTALEAQMLGFLRAQMERCSTDPASSAQVCGSWAHRSPLQITVLKGHPGDPERSAPPGPDLSSGGASPSLTQGLPR